MTTEPIRNKNDVRRLAEYYLNKGQLRNYALVVLGVHTALRISDLLRLRWDDVYDFEKNRIRDSVTIIEGKTRKSKTFALNKAVIRALTLLAAQKLRQGAFLIENPKTKKAISRIQAYRLIRAASEALGFQQRVSCHSLRKTFGYHSWKSGVSTAVLVEIYNHSSLNVTRRYLGITQDDKNAVYMGLRLIS
ncbi:MAG: tyrosine-type recombinase/integrase [Oscillospiraceae bacterium]|nr:tyrosine-type recombinase/integrase [Oscillospiraceae bacterium]